MDDGYERYHPDMAAIRRGFRTQPCFVCGMVAGDGRSPKNVIYEDEGALAFLEGYPRAHGYTLVNLGALLVPLTVVGTFGWWRQAGLALPRPDRSWLTLLPLLFFALSFAAGGLSGSPALLWSSAILFLALGINKDLLYRGVIQHATNVLGAVRSVVWVGLLFDLQHAGTGIFFGHSLYDTGTMMISSTASGAA